MALPQSFLQLLCCSVGKGQKQIQTDPLPRLKNLSLRILPKKSFLPFRMYRTLPYWSISFAPIRIDRLNAKSNGKKLISGSEFQHPRLTKSIESPTRRTFTHSMNTVLRGRQTALLYQRNSRGWKSEDRTCKSAHTTCNQAYQIARHHVPSTCIRVGYGKCAHPFLNPHLRGTSLNVGLQAATSLCHVCTSHVQGVRVAVQASTRQMHACSSMRMRARGSARMLTDAHASTRQMRACSSMCMRVQVAARMLAEMHACTRQMRVCSPRCMRVQTQLRADRVHGGVHTDVLACRPACRQVFCFSQ